MANSSILIMGIAVAINIIIIMWKVEHGRISDAILDGGILFLLGFVFMGTVTGLMVGTVASSMVSLYLLFNRPHEWFKKEAKPSQEVIDFVKGKMDED